MREAGHLTEQISFKQLSAFHPALPISCVHYIEKFGVARLLKISLKRIWFVFSTKESNHKWLQVVKLRQYWPELDFAAFEEWDTINIDAEVY